MAKVSSKLGEMRQVMGQIRTAFFGSLCVLGVTACGDGDSPPAHDIAKQPNPEASAQKSDYGIKVFVKRDGVEHLVTVKPADMSVAEVPSIKTKSLGAPGQRPQSAGGENVGEIRQAATVKKPDGTVETTDDDVVPGWTLLKWAALSCSSPQIDDASHNPYDFVTIGAPWQGDQSDPNYLKTHFYIFDGGDSPLTFMNTCDSTLYREEQLLCAADRLAQIGDSAGTVYWDSYDYQFVNNTLTQVPLQVTIPPQATKDKFVARDMALNALGHLARLTLRQQHVRLNESDANAYGDKTCSEWYADVANTGNSYWHDDFVSYTQATNSIFTTYDPPDDYFGDEPFTSGVVGFGPAYGGDVENRKGFGRRRLGRMSNLLSAASRLTRDLVDRSVKDDISGAQKAFAAAGDRHASALRAWGLDAGQEPYNNLRHALRTLYGRLEMGPHAGSDRVWDPHGISMDDPACYKTSSGATYSLNAGVVASDLLLNMEEGLDARWHDIAPSTRGETFALSVLSNAGIVFATPQGVAAATARSAVAEQLVRAAAKRAKLSYADFIAQQADVATAVRASVSADNISDAELIFGLERVYDAFRLLTYSGLATGSSPTDYAAALNASALAAGVSVQSGTDTPEVAAAGGMVLSGALPRGALNEDLTARMYDAKVYSNCGVNPTGSSTASRRSYALGPYAGDGTAMQNPFMLGDSFRRQMTLVGGLLTDTNADLQKTKAFLSMSAAETRQWSGHGVIAREYDSSAGVDRYYLVDVTLEDLGVKDDAELAARLKTVWNGNLIGIECLAGKRDKGICPAGFEPDVGVNVGQPRAGGITHNTAYAGAETYIRSIEFTHSSTSRSLVLAAAAGKQGRVLASFRGTARNGEIFAEPLSDWQEELTARAFGLGGHDATPERTCSATPPLSQPSKYCIDGMDRDQFVPLANELTSSSGGASEDSWKHYLDVAETAAAKADELARQMIETGLSNDIRKEAASESVAELCGSFPHDASTASASNGNVNAAGDAAIDTCLKPATIDMVFLAIDPLPAANGNLDTIHTNNDKLCKNFGCSGTGLKLPWCTKCDTDDEITHAGLGLTERLPLSDDELDPYTSCLDIPDTLTAGSLDSGRFSAVAHLPWVNEGDLSAALQDLLLVENPDRSWYLQLNDKQILHAAPGGDLTYPDATSATHRYYVNGANGRDVYTSTGIAPKLFSASSASNSQAMTREQVELALFYLGALAGGIPSGRIYMPVPAINKSAPDGASTNANPLTYYSAGYFHHDVDQKLWTFLGENHRGYSPISLADEAWMPKAWDNTSPNAMPAAFFLDRAEANPALPGTAWRSSLYAQAAAGSPSDLFLPLWTTNSPIKYSGNLVGGEQVGPLNENAQHDLNWTNNNSRAYLGAWLEDLARSYQDHKLDPANGPQATALKLQQAAWQYTRFRLGAKDANGVQKATDELDYNRSICDRAYVGPVFTKYLGQKTGRAEWFDDQNHPLNGQMLSWIAAYFGNDATENKYATDPFQMLATVGREGGPKSNGLIAQNIAVAPDQEQWKDNANPSVWGYWKIGDDRLLPTQCAPSERLEAFLRTELSTNLEAMQTLTRALGLACMATQNVNYGAIVSKPPPPVQSMDDLRYLENWLAMYAHAASRIAGNLFLTDVPATSLGSVANGTVGIGAVSQGEQGKLLLEIEEGMRKIGDGFHDTASLFQTLAADIRVARLQIEGAQLQGQSKELALALQSIETNRQLALSYAHDEKRKFSRAMSLVSGLGTAVASYAESDDGSKYSNAAKGADGLFGAIESYIVDIDIDTDYEITQDYSKQIQSNLQQQADVTAQLTANGVAQVIGSLNTKLPGIYTAIGDHLSEINNTVSDTEQNIITFKQNRDKAAIAVAKATGADFVEVNGASVPLHVNTVYRRQFDVLRLRYERALESAKRAAYLARLAIEERIGVRLNDLQSPIGPLEAPKLWVDDLCTVQGVDYDKLRTATPPEQDATGAAEIDKVAGFADQYIGDYVAKLREFVDFYNVENPFKESRDTAIVSLREMMGDADARCIAPSTNLLFYSDRLDQRPSNDGAAEAEQAVGGWRVSGCTDSACLDVQGGIALKDDNEALAPPSNPGATTWLTSIARDADWSISSGSVPPAIVYQSVDLRAGGTYVLSWWDQARTAEGEATAADAATTNYPVKVYDSEWRLVSADVFTPANAAWSERRSLFVQPSADGIYHVAFAAAEANVTGASLAIANVQLEGGQSTVMATAYAQTGATRVGVTSKCQADDPAEFRDRFDYKCDGQSCFYELRDLLRLDTQLLQQGYSPLTGKVASGNYNYRLGTVALNLVGTGLVDCSQSPLPSCYTSGYIEYDLSHQAQNVPMEDYAGKTRCFDFETGNIHGGKALATERVLSLPLSSTDQGLVEQPSISKEELTGRPLAGTYRLRIRDEPGFVWQRLDDIQLLVNYGYWSRVSKTGG